MLLLLFCFSAHATKYRFGRSKNCFSSGKTCVAFLTTPLEYLDNQDINNHHIGPSGKVKEKIRRFQFFSFLYVFDQTGFKEIGGHLGGRDHTTVMHACSKIGRAQSSDPQMHATLAELTKQITQVPRA